MRNVLQFKCGMTDAKGGMTDAKEEWSPKLRIIWNIGGLGTDDYSDIKEGGVIHGGLEIDSEKIVGKAGLSDFAVVCRISPG